MNAGYTIIHTDRNNMNFLQVYNYHSLNIVAFYGYLDKIEFIKEMCYVGFWRAKFKQQ